MYQIRGSNRFVNFDKVCHIMSKDTLKKHKYKFEYRNYICTIYGMNLFNLNINGEVKLCACWHCGYINLGSDDVLFDNISRQIEQKTNVEFTARGGIDFAHINDVILQPVYESPDDSVATSCKLLYHMGTAPLSLAIPEYIAQKLKHIIDVFIDITSSCCSTS